MILKIRIVVLFQSLLCMLISVICLYRDFANYGKIENKLICLAETLVVALIFILIEHYIINNEKISTSVLTLFPMAFIFLFLLSTPKHVNDFNVLEDFTIPICNLLSNLYLSFSIGLSLISNAKKEKDKSSGISTNQ